MADYLKLFLDKRLSINEAHHLEYIKGRLASLKVEDPAAYAEYSQYYGVDLDVAVTKEPGTTVKAKPAKNISDSALKALKIKKTK